MKIYIAMHKDWPLPSQSEIFTPIGCGGYQPQSLLHSLIDSVDINISSKNIHYSELTAWYWVWKNIKNNDVVGFCHYRRYFFLNPFHELFNLTKMSFIPDAQNLAFLVNENCESVIKQALTVSDVIVPRREKLNESIADHYKRFHVLEDWNLFIEAIKNIDKNLYNKIDYLYSSENIHLYNMMICKKEYFDNYMNYLFSVMEFMEKQKPFRMESYQCRVPAFLAERFFTLYLHATRARCFEVPVAMSRPL